MTATIRRFAVAATAAACATLVGCSAPRQDSAACSAANADMVNSASVRLKPGGVLRHGFVVPSRGDNVVFLSVELHPTKDAVDKKGDILTFATEAGSSAFVAVDENARKDSTWPRAPFDVRKNGAITSRACTDRQRGKA